MMTSDTIDRRQRVLGAIVLGSVIVMLLGLSGRLVHINTALRPRLLAHAERQYAGNAVLPAQRGRIFDSRGRVVATSRRMWDVFLDPVRSASLDKSVDAPAARVDVAPGTGGHAGKVGVRGKTEDLVTSEGTLTGRYPSGRMEIEITARRTAADPQKIFKLIGASGNNLKHVTLEIPAGLFTCVTGVSGSGKSTLINDTLHRLAARELYDSSAQPAPYEDVENLGIFDKVIDIDQSPIGRTPRSNPTTYTGLFTPIRELFAGTHEARSRGYKPGRFSFNVKGGRC